MSLLFFVATILKKKIKFIAGNEKSQDLTLEVIKKEFLNYKKLRA